MFRRSPLRSIASLIASAVLLSAAAVAGDAIDLKWENEDVLLRFSDSLRYTVDLAASDSSQLVIRIGNARLPRSADQGGISLPGPRSREAILTQSGPDELRLTVRAPSRLGYASIWRPYSNTLVVHTFNWDRLEYAQEEYYKGLLAFEQGLEAQGLEILRIAYATGDPRAASVLGVYHARRGENALASQYLSKPLTADDYAALAAMQLKGGDSTGAARNQDASREMLAEQDTAWKRSNAMARRNDTVQQVNNDFLNFADPSDKRWIYLIGGLVALLLLILLAIWISRRSSRRRPVPEPVVPDRTYPPARRETVERTVEAREVRPVPAEPRREPAPAPPVQTVPEAVVVETQAPPPPVVTEPSRTEMPAPAASEPPTVETTPVTTTPVETTPVEKIEPTDLPQPVAIEEAIDVKSRPAEGTPEPGARRPLPTQAAELRRKIEAMRAAPAPPPAPQKKPAPSSESTISEARRLQLSRDSVELRRRLQQDKED